MDLLPSSGGKRKRETYAGGHFLNGHVEKLQQKPQTQNFIKIRQNSHSSMSTNVWKSQC